MQGAYDNRPVRITVGKGDRDLCTGAERKMNAVIHAGMRLEHPNGSGGPLAGLGGIEEELDVVASFPVEFS